jgi:hypothetical protein
VHDAVMQLTEGGCDLLIAYHHPSQPLQLNPDRYEMLSLGHETLAPYAKAGGTASRCSSCRPRRAPGALSRLCLGRLHGPAGRGHQPSRRARP